MIRLLLIFLMITSINAMANNMGIVPNFKPIVLKEFTTMSLDIMPDTGTQLIFPFKLDNPELNPALKIKLSNSAGFWVPTDKLELVQLTDQNTLTILGLAQALDIQSGSAPVFVGNLFISIGGYNLSIALKTTYDYSKVVTNVVFDIPDAKRAHLVEQAVKRHTDKLELAHKDKMDRIDILAKENAMKHVGVMAMVDPDMTRFKIEGDVLINGNRLAVYADKIANYDDEYYIVLFDIENHSNVDFSVSSYSLSGVFSDNERAFRGDFNCREKLRADGEYHCAFVTLDSSVENAEEYTLKMMTDRGEGVYSW